jgi:hypothetical protein
MAVPTTGVTTHQTKFEESAFEHGIRLASERLQTVKTAFANQQETDFWQQCVRDTQGKLLMYTELKTRYGVSYFRGAQPTMDYAEPAEVTYLSANIDVRTKFYNGLQQIDPMGLSDFGPWLVELRHAMEYRFIEEWLHHKFSTSGHTAVVKGHVLDISKQYHDPYSESLSKRPFLPGIRPKMLPRDDIVGENIVHHYPKLDCTDAYLTQALASLKKISKTMPIGGELYVKEVANFIQYLVNLHLFAGINNSLYMNMANGLLEVATIPGIEHSIIDFVAMRLQPENFQQYFFELVKQSRKHD